MRPDRVEIAQQSDVPGVVGMIQILENLLLHQFCRSVRIGRRKAAILVERQTFGLAVHRRRRREHEVPDLELFHRFKQHQRGDQVVVVVFDRFLDAFADCFQPGKVNDPIDFVRRENFLKLFSVPHVIGIKNKVLPRDLPDAPQAFLIRIAEIIHNNYIIARRQQFHHRMRTDIARAARYKNCHFDLLSTFSVQG